MDPSSSVIFELLPAIKVSERFSVNSTTGAPRKVHIRRLFDLLQMCLLRRQADHAQRIWSILVRCREVDFAMLWDLGLHIMQLPHPNPRADPSAVDHHLTYLKACRNICEPEVRMTDLGICAVMTCFLFYPSGFPMDYSFPCRPTQPFSLILLFNQASKILLEYICVLVSSGRLKDAFDELQFWLSALPCSQHAGLHEYAGLVTLAIIPAPQPSDDDDEIQGSPHNIQEYLEAISGHVMFGKAKAYFEKAQSLDSTCVVSAAYLKLMASCSTYREDDDM